MKSYLLYPMVACFFLNVGIFTETRSAEENYNKRIVCVFNKRNEDDSTYMHPYNYEPEDVPTELCTDVVYHALGVDIDTWELENPTPPSADRMRRLTSLGAAGPLKFLLRVWNVEDWRTLSPIAADPSKRLSFVSSALRLVRDYGFNGLDLYWASADPEDRENYVKLVEELVEAFKPSRLLLTISVELGNLISFNNTVSGYDIQRLSELVDWIHVEAFMRRYITADCHSPLYRRPFDVERYKHRNVHDGMEMMVRMGAPRHKLVLELTFTGISNTLENPNNQNLNAPVNLSGAKGLVTGEKGLLAYFEICRSVTSGSWTRRFDHVGMCPYAFHGDQWVSYEDEQSILIKMNYVKSRGFGGAYVSDIQYDDFNGFCGSKNQLLRTVHDALLKKEERTVDSNSMESVLRKRYEAMGIVPIACNGL